MMRASDGVFLDFGGSCLVLSFRLCLALRDSEYYQAPHPDRGHLALVTDGRLCLVLSFPLCLALRASE